MTLLSPAGPEAAVEQMQRRLDSLCEENAALKARESAWRAREEDLDDFVENAAVGLHRVGPDGTILWANAADCVPLGYAPDEYIGHNIAEFHADQAALCSILEHLLEGRTLNDRPAILKCKDGSVRHVLISSNAHFENGRFVNTRCFTRDVTDQLRTEQALHEARARLAALVESSDDAVIALEMDGSIASWNGGAQRLYGYTADEVIGRSIATLIPGELSSNEARIVERVRAGERVEHYETVRVTKSGTRLNVSLTVSPIRDVAGNLIGVSKVARDITERKNAQRELAVASQRKDEFLAILAHELRNPLAPIRYALSVVGRPDHSAQQRERAQEIIVRQVEHMARLLDDLLDVSRVARGHVELRKKWIDLTLVIGNAIDAARPLIDARNHSLSLDLPREALRLEADPVRLTQILSNLLTNAAKYTDSGGEIRLRALREADEIVVSVSDNGIGISSEMVPRLFTLFSQSKPAMQRAEGGLGVGLALVKGFAEMHGGSVAARSDGPRMGSEFTVRLPVGTPPGSEDRDDARAAAPGRARPLRVLVADDNTDAAETCAMMLKMWGHEVRSAHDGEEALAIASAFQPDLAVLDIGMPGANGYQVAERIRAMPWGTNARLVAVTGWGQEEDKRQASLAGFDRHLTKPVDPAALRALVESLS